MGEHDRPPQVADPTWLALRRAADTRARDTGAAGLLDELLAHLGKTGGVDDDTPLTVVDVGAGTGANHAYLSPRLPVPQRWVAVDHDPDLVTHPCHEETELVVADVQDLDTVLTRRDGPVGGPTLITCSALLDVLDTGQLAGLARAVVATGGPALLALSVTGAVHWSAPDPEDAWVQAAFDGHQRRRGRPGPGAPEEVAARLAQEGMRVLRAPTPWLLRACYADEARLLRRWLDERVAAVLEQEPALAGSVGRWRARRRAQLDAGVLEVRVDHVDLLALPPAPGRR